jgi:Dienelactone hydrolase family
MRDHITVKGQDGTLTAYFAKPEELPAPAVIVLQELFGVNAEIREKCNELAEQGFISDRAGPILASRARRRPRRPFRGRLAAWSSPLSSL